MFSACQISGVPNSPPGSDTAPVKAPDDFAVKMQPLTQSMQDEVASCGTKFLGVDFGATIEVAYFIYTDGKAYVPTVISSDVGTVWQVRT